MSIKTKVYRLLVERVPAIKKEYSKIRKENQGILGAIYALSILLWFNLCWIMGNRKLEEKIKHPDGNKKINPISPESTLDTKLTPEELAEYLFQADIISFDIFDTLIFRPVSSPTDLFFFMGEKLNYMDFERIRREMEGKAREKAFRLRGTYEVTLEEIYEEVEKWTGIPKEQGMQYEIEMELESSFANPYLYKVYQLLVEKIRKTEKKIICVSDMYLSKEVLEQMLHNCGYNEFSNLYVSCEYNKAKGDGLLYKEVMTELGSHKRYVHLGDNINSDVIRAKENGWDAIHYPNINTLGVLQRAEDLSAVTGSLYRGIVNSRLYNGICKYTIDYEIGYIYGGLFVTAYCQFIHQYRKNNNVDKLLFLSRDGDIIKKVYEYMYPEEREICEYAYWSRTVATKLMAKYDRYDYFRRFLYHKVNQKITLREIFQSMEIEDLLQENGEVYLTDQNVESVKEDLISRWSMVLEHYKELMEAGRVYYEKVLAGCNNALAIDVGWAGSGAIALDFIANKEWKLQCDIIGMIAGSNTANNYEVNASEVFLYSGKLVSFLYSQEHNREFWKYHNPAEGHNLLIELLLSSAEGSLKNIILDNSSPKGYKFIFKSPDVEKKKVEGIQGGILDFVKDYTTLSPKLTANHMISGSDVYSVLKIFLQSDIVTTMEKGI